MKGDGFVLLSAAVALGAVALGKAAFGPSDKAKATLEAVEFLHATPTLQQAMFGKTSLDKKEIMTWMLDEKAPLVERSQFQLAAAQKARGYGYQGNPKLALVALVMIGLSRENREQALLEISAALDRMKQESVQMEKDLSDVAHSMGKP